MRNLRYILLPIAAIALFAWCGRQQPALVADRRAGILSPESAMAGTPPMVAFTTVILGGFRGVLADVLWLRVSMLQSEGRFFELVQLSDWITMLEPRSTGTWSFHAWNMAYNVSGLMADSAERWQWIQNGIRLLRDKGLRHNPHDARLYFELGWLFQHKLGARTDKAWLYYQQRLAVETEASLPGGSATNRVDPERLRAETGFDADRLRAMDAQHGPLDWRLPESHALYWASEGLRRGGDPHDFRCERMRYQCLAVSMLQGRLTLDPAAGLYQRAPRPDLFDRVLAVYAEAAKGPHADPAAESYRHFLTEAERVLTESGHTREAARARERLQAK